MLVFLSVALVITMYICGISFFGSFEHIFQNEVTQPFHTYILLVCILSRVRQHRSQERWSTANLGRGAQTRGDLTQGASSETLSLSSGGTEGQASAAEISMTCM